MEFFQPFKKTKLKSITLYTSGICNLNCSYCYVAKNKYLNDVHSELMSSFKSPCYYVDFLNRLKEYFYVDELNDINFWGAEPTYGFYDIIPTIYNIVSNYPKIKNYTFSTNFTLPDVVDRIKYLFNNIPPSKDKKCFLQISIDGPSYINDLNRGNGTTEKIVYNFDKLLESLDYIDATVQIMFKPTLSLENIRFLNNNNLIYDYYNWFEQTFIKKMKDIGYTNYNSVSVSLACPGLYSSEDGIEYAKFLKESFRISHEHRLNVFSIPKLKRINSNKDKFRSYGLTGGTCGTGFNNIGLLPNYKVCMCHRAFGDFVESYNRESQKYSSKLDSIDNRLFNSENIIDNTIFPYQELEKYSLQYRAFYLNGSTSLMSSYAILIKVLADCGQIDTKYSNFDNALDAARMMKIVSPVCIKDIHQVTGTSYPSYGSLIRLYLNGALEEILNESKKYI